MDLKGAGQDAANLQARQDYLTQLAVRRCVPGYRPPDSDSDSRPGGQDGPEAQDDPGRLGQS
jgi:hypothetical protein